MAERDDEARALFERLLAIRNDLGLLSEEYDPAAKRLLGNFPQAFTHVGLVNSAYNLSHHDRAGAPAHRPALAMAEVVRARQRRASPPPRSPPCARAGRVS